MRTRDIHPLTPMHACRYFPCARSPRRYPLTPHACMHMQVLPMRTHMQVLPMCTRPEMMCSGTRINPLTPHACMHMQVLPMRTHPEMMCSGTGGYVLSGIKVLAEACSGKGVVPVGAQAAAAVPVVPVGAQAAATAAAAPPAVSSDSAADQRGVKRDRAEE